MPKESRIPNLPPEIEAYSAYLKRQQKIDDWFYGSLIVGCFLAIIFAGIMWVRELIAR